MIHENVDDDGDGVNDDNSTQAKRRENRSLCSVFSCAQHTLPKIPSRNQSKIDLLNFEFNRFYFRSISQMAFRLFDFVLLFFVLLFSAVRLTLGTIELIYLNVIALLRMPIKNDFVGVRRRLCSSRTDELSLVHVYEELCEKKKRNRPNKRRKLAEILTHYDTYDVDIVVSVAVAAVGVVNVVVVSYTDLRRVSSSIRFQ